MIKITSWNLNSILGLALIIWCLVNDLHGLLRTARLGLSSNLLHLRWVMDYLLHRLAWLLVSSDNWRSGLDHFGLCLDRLFFINSHTWTLNFIWVLNFWTISLLLLRLIWLLLLLLLFVTIIIYRIRLLENDPNWICLLRHPSWRLLNHLLNDVWLLATGLWNWLLNSIWHILWLVLPIYHNYLIWLLVYILVLLRHILSLPLVEIGRHSYDLLFLFKQNLRWLLRVISTCLLETLRNLLINGICLVAFAAVSGIDIAVEFVLEQKLVSGNQSRSKGLLLSLNV